MTTRVLHLAGEYPPRRLGGIATYLENVVRRSAPRLVTGVVVVEGQDYHRDPAAAGRAVRVQSVSLDALIERLPERSLLSGSELEAHIPTAGLLGEAWDVVHVHDWYGVLPALALRARQPVRLVMTAHLPLRFGFTYANHPIPVQEKTRLEAMGFRMVDRVIAPSHYIQALLAREYDVPDQKIRVVPNGVDVEAFRPVRGPEAEVPTLLAVSRLSDQKGLDYLLEVLRRVRVSRPDAVLRIAGDGPERERVARRAELMGLSRHVELLGYVAHAELPALYAAASVFLSTSVYEPFGLTTLEAMASGCPVVVSALGGAGDFVRDGVDGFVRYPQHLGAFSDAVLSVISEPVVRRRMADSARSRAEQLAWAKVTDATVAVYSELVGESEELRRVS
ncbi:MAG: glycosyltransferase family 4 protein [Polyangiaceae bacterium]|nr:glycosyltransferase family 4 protein [Polyangiaceae bacterium]